MNIQFTKEDFAWLVSFRHPSEIWLNHRSYLLQELSLYLLAFVTLKHAVSRGGRFKYLWFTAILHGLVIESLSYFVPDVDNFWHAQSMVMFLGKRLPLHVVLLYPVFYYTAITSVARLRLRTFVEPFAVGLSVVLLDVPFDILGIKFLFWTWHDTDPNIFDRHYWVPWTSYYFHAAFASSFAFLFHASRSWMTDKCERYESAGFFRELFSFVVTGLLATPLGIVQFLPLYHPLHDSLHIHSEVCVLLFLVSYILVVWVGDRHHQNDARATHLGKPDEIFLAVLVHYCLYIALILTESPKLIRSVGLHQPIGDCNATTPVHVVTGQVLYKQTYLCTSNYDEAYFDFHCLPGGVPQHKSGDWYSICGTPFSNRAEYIVVVTAFCLLGLFIYVQMLRFSGRLPKVPKSSKFKDE